MDLDDQFEDFTTASDWECFTAALEQYLSEWQGRPVEPENVHNNWISYQEKVTFADWPFKFSYFKLVNLSSGSTINELQNSESSLPPYLSGALSISENEFPPLYFPHVAADLYSVKEFAVLTSATVEPLNNESKLKILLSSACIALNSTSSVFPIFVQFHHCTQNYFVGIAESSGIRTSFQMIHLRKVSDKFNYLSGLLDIFKSKIGCNLNQPIEITAHFFYKMKAWHSDFTYDSYPPEVFEMLQAEDVENLTLISKHGSRKMSDATLCNESIAFTDLLPFGSLDDPFQALDLIAGWYDFTEDYVTRYSDLEPDNAPQWHFGLVVDPSAEYRLYDMLNGFWKLRGEMRSIEDILGKKLEVDESEAQYISALDRITQSSLPVPGLNQVINRAQKRLLFSPAVYTDLPPLPPEQLDTILQFLFPDAYPDARYPYPTIFDKTLEFEKEALSFFLENVQGVKSVPVGSLIWRLAIIAAHLHSYVGAQSAVAHLWAELVLEFRYRWENSILIPGLERGAPNSGNCLLNQKLQMLNCCIERKQFREKKEKSSLEADAVESPVEESEDEEDEFFDCDDTLATAVDNVTRLNKPVGRLRKCGRLRLLKTGEPMYIPITQDPAPLTEDVIDEQAKILVQLGNDAEGSALRAKMMSSSLLSDMESFKAANPGAVLEDFVRWYSPRDWNETEGVDEFGNKIGDLSPRMKMPGNLWLEVWSTAHAVPARRQRRLFDDTKEAEKVLHWMSSCNLSDVSQLLFPCLSHAVCAKLLEEVSRLKFDYKLPANLAQAVTQLSRSIGFISGNNSSSNDVNNYRTCLLSSVLKCEKDITKIRSFQQKFPQIDINEILQRAGQGENRTEPLPQYIKVEGGANSEVGTVIKEIFRQEVALNQLVDANTQFKFGEPMKRVFVLKCAKKFDSSTDGGLPQRMRCCLKPDEVILAGTFSSKTDLSY